MSNPQLPKTTSESSMLSAVVAAGLISVLATWSSDLAAQGQTTESTIVPNDVAPGDRSGSSVAVRRRVAVFGASMADAGSTDSGAAYVFEFNGNTWSQAAKLTASDGAANDQLGSAVAVGDGGTIVVGAEGKDSARGTAYVFEKNAGVWVQIAKLIASDGQAADHFGFATAIDGDTLIVGAWGRNGVSGAAYVFERSNGGWQETATLIASDSATSDYFGYTVSVQGDIALIGSPGDDDRGTNSGSAYVFVRSNGTWTQTAKLVATDGAAQDLFALTGSISNGTVVIGARNDDDFGLSSGSAYVFQSQNGAWTQTAKLLASDGRTNDIFGHAVSISGDRIVVGAKWRDDNGGASGAAYVFGRTSTGTWSQTARLNASDARGGDAFGQSVAINGRVILVGAWLRASLRGATYVYQEPSLVDPNLSTVTADDSSFSAFGGTTRIEVTPKKADGTNVGTGLDVQIDSTGGLLIGQVSDNGDGTYTQVLEGSQGPSEIVVTAIADGVPLVDSATIALITVGADTSTITVSPSELTAGQSATVTVTAKTPTGDNAGTGLIVTIDSTLGDLVGSVADNGDGTYSQRIDTTAFGTADISATVNGVALTASATLIVQPKILGSVVGFRADDSIVVYRTIQDAVRRATLHRLVKVVVAPGHYNEIVRIYKQHGLRLETMPSLGLTTIRGLRIWRSSGITIDSFEIDATNTRRHGIVMHRSKGVVMRTTIVKNARGSGIVIGHRCSDVLVDQCLVENNGRDGIRVRHDTRDLRILRGTVLGNGSGGIHIGRRVHLRIQGCEIVDNGNSDRRRRRCRTSGYGIYLRRTNGHRQGLTPERVTLIRNTVEGNRGRAVRKRSDANFGNYDQFIDATDDQAPFNR